MLCLDNIDVLKAWSDTDAKVECVISGFDGSVFKNLYSGTLSDTPNTVIYTAVTDIAVVSVSFVNTHDAAVTLSFKLDPGNGGNPKWIIPVDVTLEAGYQLLFDGAKFEMIDTSGQVIVTFPFPLVVDNGGTGLTSYVVGDLIYASDINILSRLADVVVNRVLVSGGVGAAPAWSGTPIVQTLTATAGIVVNSAQGSGEVGINLYSIDGTFSTICQIDAEDIANSSDLRIGLDPTTYNLIIVPRALIGNDFGLVAASDPKLRIYNSTGNNYATLKATELSLGSGSAYLTYSAGKFTLGSWGKGITFHSRSDLVEGNLYIFESAANIELIDDDGQQAWMCLEVKSKMTAQGAFNAFHIDLFNGNTYGDGTTGDGNNFIRLSDDGTTKFKIDITGGVHIPNMKSGINQGAAGAAANELWHDTTDETIKIGV